MNRRNFQKALLAALLLMPACPGLSQQEPFVFGTVKWKNGLPAQGLEVRLTKGEEIAAASFTDQDGFYAFFDVPGRPDDYRLVVASARAKLADVPILPTAGGEVPITLE